MKGYIVSNISLFVNCIALLVDTNSHVSVMEMLSHAVSVSQDFTKNLMWRVTVQNVQLVMNALPLPVCPYSCLLRYAIIS